MAGQRKVSLTNTVSASEYFKDVGAPQIFDRLAQALLLSTPPKDSVLQHMIEALQAMQAGEEATPQVPQSHSPPPGELGPSPASDRAFRKRQELTFAEIDALCQKDGSVSKEELLRVMCDEQLAAKVLFRELDVDKDGAVTILEWKAWFDRIPTADDVENQLSWIEDRIRAYRTQCLEGKEQPRSPGKPPKQQVAELKLRRENLRTRARETFDGVDQQCSRDGTVSMDELLRVLRQERLGARVFFRELDTNSDGGVTLKEWMAWFESTLRRSGENDMESRLEWIEDRLRNDELAPAPEEEQMIEEMVARGRSLNARLQAVADTLAPPSVEPHPPGRREARKSSVRFSD